MDAKLLKIIVRALSWGAVLGSVLVGARQLFGHNPVEDGFVSFYATVAFVLGRRFSNWKGAFYLSFFCLVAGIMFWPFVSRSMHFIPGLRMAVPLFAVLLGLGLGLRVPRQGLLSFALAALACALVLFIPAAWVLKFTALVIAPSLLLMFVFSGNRTRRFAYLIPALLALAAPWLTGKLYFGAQRRHVDKVLASFKTSKSRVVLTEWRNDRSLFENGYIQLSTLDAPMFYEPMVIPAMSLFGDGEVLLLGGENGRAASDVIRYVDKSASVDKLKLTVLPYDSEKLEKMASDPLFRPFHYDVWKSERLRVDKSDVFEFLKRNKKRYSLVIVDMPDPVDKSKSAFYTQEFYEACHEALKPGGGLVTQAGNCGLATKAFAVIANTIRASGFGVVELRNQVPSLGEWGWCLASVAESDAALRERLEALDFEGVPTRWLNRGAVRLLLAKGKDAAKSGRVNHLDDPVLLDLYGRR